MQFSVRRQNTAFRQGQGISTAICHAATGFFDKQATGCEVPRREFILEECAELTATNLAEIKRGGAEPADTVNLLLKEVAD